MFRRMFLIVAIAAFGLFSLEAKAQSDRAASTQRPQSAEQVQQEPSRQQITAGELPDSIKQALKNEALKEWQVSEVYIVASNAQDAEAKATYEVYFTNADQKRAIGRFNAEGKSIAGQ